MKILINVNRYVCLSVAVVVLVFCSSSRADITGYTLTADGNGVMTCSTYGFVTNAPGEYQLGIYGHHNVFGAGDISGSILTDGTDPALTLNHTINNDTAFIWTDYHVKITLSQTFTLTGVSVANTGWTPVVTAPTLVGTDWIGFVDFYSGIPVGIGQILNFSYTVNFVGSVAFSEELTPTTSVPEPTSGMFILLGMGALVCTWRLKQDKQICSRKES